METQTGIAHIADSAIPLILELDIKNFMVIAFRLFGSMFFRINSYIQVKVEGIGKTTYKKPAV